MKKIGGNTDLILKVKSQTENEIGEKVTEWINYKTIHGFMDFMSETTGRTNYNSKIVESTHVFVCDYVDIDKSENELKAYHNNKQYEITYIDDPMELHYHLEIFLKYIGD
jgi:epoxyqueuosine reductase QueG